MASHRSSHALVCLVTFGLFSLGSGVSLGQDETRNQQGTDEQRILGLQKECRGILHQLQEMQLEAYHRGEAPIEELIRARSELLQFDMALAVGQTERSKLLEEAVQLAKSFEELAATKYQSGHAPAQDVLKCRVHRIKMEIELLRERGAVSHDLDVK